MHNLLARRALLGVAAALSLPAAPRVASADGLPRADIAAKLSRVPIFAVTNREAAPYLTEMDGAGRRSGFFFISPQEAVSALNDIKAFDPRASLSVVPLDDVFFDISATAEAAAAAPQPTAGTSTDMRLFRLRALDDEMKAASSLTQSGFDANAVPLFFEPSLSLAVDGTPQRPYFFRFGDLRTAFEAQKEAGDTSLNDPPSPRVAALTDVVRGLEVGAVPSNTVLVAASEAAAVVARMNGGAEVSPASPSGDAPAEPARKGSTQPDPFFLTVPFANGRRV